MHEASAKHSSYRTVEELEATFKQLGSDGGDASIQSMLRILDEQTWYQRPFAWGLASMVSFGGIAVLCFFASAWDPHL